MGTAKYTGKLLEDLLGLTWQQFHEKYPDIKNNTWKGKRSYHKRRVAEGRVGMEREPSRSWEVAAFNRETQEWETHTLHSYDHTPEAELWQATPANITPSNREPVSRDHESFFVFSDPQIGFRRILNREIDQEEFVPIHDPRKMATARQLADFIRPDYIINLGDTIDLAEFSRFPADSNHFEGTLERSLQAVHDMYAGYRSDHPQARIIEVSSNHNERFNKTVLQNMRQFYNVKRAGDTSQYPVASYPFMANLEHVGVEWHDGYPVGEYIHERVGKAALRFAHGTETTSGMSSAASKAMRNHPETNNFQGHSHADSEAWHTLRSGEQVGTFVLGALCNSLGLVPGVRSAVTASGIPVPAQQNWTSSVMHIRLYEGGEMEVNRIMINADGTARYEGKEYASDE